MPRRPSCSTGPRSATPTSRSQRRCARARSRASRRGHGPLRARAASTRRSPRRECASVLNPFPDTAAIQDSELVLGGLRATQLAEEFGTPLVVLDEATLRARARAYRDAAPDALVA